MEGGPLDAVAVETNWVLDVTLHQDQGSEELLRQAELGLVRVFLPSFCVAESIKRFEAIRQEWNDLQQALKKAAREILRSPHLAFADERLRGSVEILAEASDVAEGEFWGALERVVRTARLLTPGPETVALTAELRDFLGLEPADAAVLAEIVLARRSDTCRRFMSRDVDFQAAPIARFMADEGIEYLDSPFPIVGPLRSRVKEP